LRGLLMQLWGAALNGRTSTKDRICRYRCRMFPCAIHTIHCHSQSIPCWPFLSRETQVHRLNSSLPRLRSELLSCGSQGLLETGFVQKSSSAPCWSTFDNSRKNCSCSENAICC